MKIDRFTLALCLGFSAVLLFSGVLRYSGSTDNFLNSYAQFSTLIYIGGTVLFAVLLTRAGVSFDRMGFGKGLKVAHFILGAIGIATIWIVSQGLGWGLEHVFGETRDLDRFESIAGSLPDLLILLAISWTVAAIGEELAFRIILMKGFMAAFGQDRRAILIAVIAQAVIFGLVHSYQGPAGVIGSALNGLIYGVLVLRGRGAIWPAVIAHGGTNTIGLLSLYFGIS